MRDQGRHALNLTLRCLNRHLARHASVRNLRCAPYGAGGEYRTGARRVKRGLIFAQRRAGGLQWRRPARPARPARRGAPDTTHAARAAADLRPGRRRSGAVKARRLADAPS
ncbi:Hypothetical protein CAP_5025 [Chondromyces apiculatus DSM 436]|uniref:Uncharacterized protein n=1 Tax=Chondromyces apiculatus DSM 436 TaxID=1192034 RepID=A0A017T3V0_9BACT|nr:Hypothetical protein CAP_5025 [Chondromyces apiculatus DSM 436]